MYYFVVKRQHEWFDRGEVVLDLGPAPNNRIIIQDLQRTKPTLAVKSLLIRPALKKEVKKAEKQAFQIPQPPVEYEYAH